MYPKGKNKQKVPENKIQSQMNGPSTLEAAGFI